MKRPECWLWICELVARRFSGRLGHAEAYQAAYLGLARACRRSGPTGPREFAAEALRLAERGARAALYREMHAPAPVGDGAWVLAREATEPGREIGVARSMLDRLAEADPAQAELLRRRHGIDRPRDSFVELGRRLGGLTGGQARTRYLAAVASCRAVSEGRPARPLPGPAQPRPASDARRRRLMPAVLAALRELPSPVASIDLERHLGLGAAIVAACLAELVAEGAVVADWGLVERTHRVGLGGVQARTYRARVYRLAAACEEVSACSTC